MSTITGRRGSGYKRHIPVSEFSDNFAVDSKIKEACIGLKPSTQRLQLTATITILDSMLMLFYCRCSLSSCYCVLHTLHL